MFELLNAGGIFMYGTLGISIATLAIALQRILSLWFKFRLPAKAQVKQVLDLSESGSFPQALQVCGMSPHPLMRIMKSALVRADRSERDIRRAIESTAAAELPPVRALTGYLPHLANLATLCGLLGTIHGLIISFKGIGNELATNDASSHKTTSGRPASPSRGSSSTSAAASSSTTTSPVMRCRCMPTSRTRTSSSSTRQTPCHHP